MLYQPEFCEHKDESNNSNTPNDKTWKVTCLSKEYKSIHKTWIKSKKVCWIDSKFESLKS